MHPATAHIKRLEGEIRFLHECIWNERKLRIRERDHYHKRLMGRFMWLVDLQMMVWAKRAVK